MPSDFPVFSPSYLLSFCLSFYSGTFSGVESLLSSIVIPMQKITPISSSVGFEFVPDGRTGKLPSSSLTPIQFSASVP